jgi:prepilin-type N-terminal cleavage/methylation domain-containing protein
MRKTSGFSFLELLVVIVLLSIFATLSITSIASYRRMVKTDDAAGAVYNLMRQARVQAITRRQFYAIAINIDPTAKTFNPLDPNGSNSAIRKLSLPGRSITLISMGTRNSNDESVTVSKILAPDILINATSGLPIANTAFPDPEKTFPTATFNNNLYFCFFDPAGRAVNAADGNGRQVYNVFYFSSFDINTATRSASLLRSVTLYGSTGGVKFWRYRPDMNNIWKDNVNAN